MLGYHFVHFQSCTCSKSLILPTQISIHRGRKHVELGMLPLPVRLRGIAEPTNVRILVVTVDENGGDISIQNGDGRSKKEAKPDCYGSKVFENLKDWPKLGFPPIRFGQNKRKIHGETPLSIQWIQSKSATQQFVVRFGSWKNVSKHIPTKSYHLSSLWKWVSMSSTSCGSVWSIG